MRQLLTELITNKKFPCIMAKSVIKTGHLKIQKSNLLFPEIPALLQNFYEFIAHYRKNPNQLHSFAVVMNKKNSFSEFEEVFWPFLRELKRVDLLRFRDAEKVSNNPSEPNFSYSIGSEAFFILALHPDSPRFARRFQYPAIIFNPHQQFEKLRQNGLYTKIRNLIRQKDFMLQGSTNPMLTDFGTKSEVYQYLGKTYSPEDVVTDQLRRER